MNTITTRDTTPAQQAAIPAGRNHRLVAVIASACVACAALAAAAVIAVVHSDNSAASTLAPAAAAPVTPGTDVSTSSHPVTPPVHPSATVMTLQRELGQLNYYEGPADGIMGPQTIDAINYLQRDAGLPQTGQMNAATSAALAHFLAHGNNQMGGNS